jgi:hypothetical protein
MAELEKLDGNIQKNLLALLCYDNKASAEVASMLEANQFDGLTRTIATAVYQYRSQYKGKVPGKRYMSTIIEQLPIQDEQLNAARLLNAEIGKLVKAINKDYVIGQASGFALRQKFKLETEALATVLTKPPYDMDKARELVHSMATYQPRGLDAGLNMSDTRQALAFLSEAEEGYVLNIKPFDKIGLKLEPKTLLLYLAFKNSGKTWFCTHVGRMCAMQGARVLHVSLEMSQKQIAGRYVQNFFGVSKYDTRYIDVSFKTEKGFAVGWNHTLTAPKLTMAQRNIRRVLKAKMKEFERYTERVVVKEFPTGSMTINMLESYLDFMDRNHNFQPNVIIVDYPDLMKVSVKDYRLDLGANIVALRGLAYTRNAALVCPSQVNRVGATQKQVRSIHTAEAMGKVNPADNVITYTQRKTEHDFHLARLLLEHARDAEVGVEVAIAQNYALGQYVTDARLMDSRYRARIEGEEEAEGQEEGAKPNGVADHEGLL